MKYGHQTKSHAHPDKMNVEIMVGGQVPMPAEEKLGYPYMEGIQRIDQTGTVMIRNKIAEAELVLEEDASLYLVQTYNNPADRMRDTIMFVLKEDFKPEVLENGVVRTIKGHIGDLMVVELKWNKGMEGAVHTHPHRQCGYILKGRFEANMDGEKKILGLGECFYAEANVPHGLIALEDDCLMLDIFTPMREDFVK